MLMFMNAPIWMRGCIGIWVLAAFFIGLVLLLTSRRRSPFRVWSMLLVTITMYLSFQCITYINQEDFLLSDTNTAAACFAVTPVLLQAVFMLLVSFLEVRLILNHLRWKRTHLTRSSIKHAVDSLPAGLCCFEDTGHIILQNTAMDRICHLLTGEALVNGQNFARKVEEASVCLESRSVLILKDEAYSVDRHTTEIKGRELVILTASNITKEYQKLQELTQKRENVLLLNEKLRTYNKEIASIITQKEILNSKIKIHDAMGSALLSAKRYITGGGSEALKEEILKELSRGVDYLLTEPSDRQRDSYQRIFEMADKLDAVIQVTGELPGDSVGQKVLSTAMHECLTNTLRHAGGDTLYVVLERKNQKLLARISNNGTPPALPVVEQGGLVTLRKLVEDSGGGMSIACKEEFNLMITLPEKGENDVV